MPAISLDDFLRSLRRQPAWRHNLETVAVRPARAAVTVPLPSHLPPVLVSALAGAGVRSLYSHQVQALALIAEGRHVVLATGTASGKSLCFHLPALAAVAAGGSALLIYPTKALARDQLRALSPLARRAALPEPVILDGDTAAREARDARGLGRDTATGAFLLTNPDYLHCRLLPRHGDLPSFWRRLRLVVLDEMHVYQGLLGHRVAGVLDRLRRVCRHHGAQPTFVTATATADQPAARAAALLGAPCAAITDDGSPRGRVLLLLGAIRAPDPLRRRWELLLAAADVLAQAVERGIRTVAFAPSRREAELLLALTDARLDGRARAHLLAGYRAGYLPETRRLLEEGLARGSFTAVVATSALELGVDLGPFALCLLCGLPPSPAALRQRMGRVGRRGQAAAVLLLAEGEELARGRSWLAAAVLAPAGGEGADLPDPWHPAVLTDQLLAAAAELPLPPGDLPPAAQREARRLQEKGLLRETPVGLVARRPCRLPPLRGGDGPPLSVVLTDHGHRPLAVTSARRAPAELPVGGIHLHLGLSYRVGPAFPNPDPRAGGPPPAWPASASVPREALLPAAAEAADREARERLGPLTVAGPEAVARLELSVAAGPVLRRQAGSTASYLDLKGRRAGWQTAVGPTLGERVPALLLEFRWDPRPPFPPAALRTALAEVGRLLRRSASSLSGLSPGHWRTAVQSPCPWTGADRLLLLCPGAPAAPLLLLRERRRWAAALALTDPAGPGSTAEHILTAVATLLSEPRHPSRRDSPAAGTGGKDPARPDGTPGPKGGMDAG